MKYNPHICINDLTYKLLNYHKYNCKKSIAAEVLTITLLPNSKTLHPSIISTCLVSTNLLKFLALSKMEIF